MYVSFGLNPLFLAALIIATVLFTYWIYRRTQPDVSKVKRFTLGALRFSALALILILLFDATLHRVKRTEQPPLLAVLMDDSQSLRLASAGPVPGDSGSSARALVRRVVDVAPRLPGQTAFFTFSNQTHQVSGDTRHWPDSLHFRGPRTNIAQALDYVREELKDRNLKGILLLSDGQYNAGRNPLHVAERYPVPVFTGVLGDTTARRDVRIQRVSGNEIAFLGTEQPVQVGIRSRDYDGQEVTVQLSRDGRVLDTRLVRMPPGESEIPVDLTYTPEAAGLQRYQISVSRLEGEITYQNNVESFVVRVQPGKKRILLVGAAPDPDLSAIRQHFQENSETELVSFVQKSPGAFYEGTFPANVGEFDSIILAGYPGRAADAATMQRIVKVAEGGKPLFFVLTTSTDLNKLKQQFAGVLPAVPQVVRSSFVEVSFDASSAASTHPVTQIDGVSPQAWKQLPPLLYNESRWTISPDARVLGTAELRGVDVGDPILIVRSRGNSRSAMILGAGSWRWKNLPADLSSLQNIWPALLSNTQQWIATPENNSPVRVRPNENVFAGGEPVQFTGEVYDESLNPVSHARVTVEVVGADSTRYPFQMTPAGNGRYLLDAGTFPEGTYQFTARGLNDDTVLGTDTGEFAVGPVTLEFKELQADAALLQQIAQRSGGIFLEADQLESLPQLLSTMPSFKPLATEEQKNTDLRRLYGLVPVILALLTAEWFIRKRNGMV